MKKHRKHIIFNNIKNYDSLNQMTLRSDLENLNIHDTYLEAEGLIHNDPPTWSIVCTTKDGGIVDNFFYESKSEYEEDLKILGLSTTKQYGYYSSAIRYIKQYEKKYGKQKFTINQLDENCFEVENHK